MVRYLKIDGEVKRVYLVFPAIRQCQEKIEDELAQLKGNVKEQQS